MRKIPQGKRRKVELMRPREFAITPKCEKYTYDPPPTARAVRYPCNKTLETQRSYQYIQKKRPRYTTITQEEHGKEKGGRLKFLVFANAPEFDKDDHYPRKRERQEEA